MPCQFECDPFQVHSLLASSSFSLAAIVYSTALSFSDEIELMWMRRPNIPSILYFLARYAMILVFASTIVTDFLPPSAVSCYHPDDEM